MEDIFQRKKRRRPFIRFGGVFFALLAVVSLVDLFRAAPLPFGAGNLESIFYRVAAAGFCGALALWFLTPPRERQEKDRLLR